MPAPTKAKLGPKAVAHRQKLPNERLLDLVQRQTFAYFDRDAPEEARIRQRITYLWTEAEWDWYAQGGRSALTWHWSPNNGFALNHPIRGWNECLITYVLAASAPRYSVATEAYHEGW